MWKKQALWRKIVILSALLILLIFAILMIFRNPIIKSLLPTIISKNSGGQTSLKIDKISLGLNGDMYILHPHLYFNNTYINQAKSMELTALAFDTVHLYGVSFRSLLFNRRIVADSLLVNKPQLDLREQKGSTKQAFNPDHLFAILGEQSGEDINQKIKIGEIRIDFGSASIAPFTESGATAEVVDFDIIIKDFSTLPEDIKKPGRIFFSDDIQFEISNINKMLVSGYDLDLGSFFFSIKKNELKISDIKLFPKILSDSINQIALSAGQIEFRGLSMNEIKGKEQIRLSSARVSDGYFITNTNRVHKNSREVHNEVFLQFAKDLSQFKLDTLSINGFDLEFLEFLSDTLTLVKDFNIELYGVEVDSSMMDDLYREIIFEEFVFNTGISKYKLASQGLMLSIDSSKYSSVIEKADLFNLNVSEIQREEGKKNIELSAGMISIGGLSSEVVPAPNKIQLTINIDDIQGLLNLDHPMFRNKSKGGSNQFFNLFDLSQVQLQNADLEVYKGTEFNIQLRQLEASIKKPLQLLNGNVSPNLESLQLNVNSLDFITQDGLNISSGPINFEKDDLLLNQLAVQYSSSNDKAEITLDKLFLRNFLLSELINDNRLAIDHIDFGRIKLKGNIAFPESSTQQQKNPPSFTLPFQSVSLKSIALKDIQLNNTFTHSSDKMLIQSNLDIELEHIELIGPDIFISDLSEIKGNVSISGTKLGLYGHSLDLEGLQLDISGQKFVLSGLNISQNTDMGDSALHAIHDFRLDLFEMDGINFHKLMSEERFQFGKLKISNLATDISLNTGSKQGSNNSVPAISMEQIMEIDFDEFGLENIHLNMVINGDSSSPMISLQDFYFQHWQTDYTEHNFMSDIAFSFGHLSMIDTLKKSYFSIDSGFYTNQGNTLRLSNISSGNLAHHNITESDEAGWSYSSSELNISNIFARNTFPTRLELGKLALSNANIVISSKHKVRKDPGLKFDIESFKQLGDLMSRLSVDTTVIQEVRVEYKTYSDTSSHVYLADSIGLVINNINIDTTVLDNSNAGIVKNMRIDFKGRTHISDDSLYKMRSGMVSYDFQKDIISIDSLQIQPRFEEEEFFRRAVYQTDMMTLFSRRIELHDFRLEELFSKNLIHFGRIDVDSIYLNMLRDKRYARKANDFKKMPQESLRDLKQGLLIDSIRVVNSFVNYGEYDHKSELPGTVYFDRFNLNLYNLSSLHPISDTASALKLKLSAFIMGQANFNLSMVAPYLDTNNNFQVTVSSEPLDMASLNPLTENLLGITIRSGHGHIKKSFITGNKDNTKGTVVFTYKKLKLGLYNRTKAQQNKGMFAGVTRFLINDIFIHSNNPKGKGDPRVGQVYFERDKEKAIVNYVWKSLLSGILSSMGINKKEQRQEKREMKSK